MYDFIAIGDTVIDAFIRLKEASVHCDVNRDKCTITMSFGDKIPYESVEEAVAVGNSANAAVAAARLGLKSALVTNLGTDNNGERCLEHLKNDGVATEFITKQQGETTNYHYVLWYEDDRTILVKHQAYDYKLPEIDPPKWLYLSSLSDHTEAYHEEIAEYVKNHPDVHLAFQPGTFQMKLGTEKLKHIYARTKVFFCNIQEAEKILGVDTLGTSELIKRLHELGPEIVVLTDGAKGAYASDGTTTWFQTPYPDIAPPVDRTGAGDAFASTVVCALASGKDLQTALGWGAINSMSVVQGVGAQKGLLTLEKLEEYDKKAPEGFLAKKL